MQERAPWLAANRYEVGEVVGRGGYGMVCRGVDRTTGRRVALKMLSPEAGRDPDVVERMLREQQALVALSGTCAVTAIDLCRLESGAPCLVMEWLDGRDLEQQLSEWEARGYVGSTSDLLALLKPLCETLARAHEIGIVHRDIKPANIFVTEGAPGGVRLLDFGLSRMKSAAPLTAVGMVMGSPSYIAPETWRGNSQALDGRADLFALAVLAFRWLTGVLPFDAPDLIGKMTAVTSGPRPSAVALRPELPVTVDAWFKRALAVEPADRFQTGGELYAAFEAALRGLPWQSSADVSGMRSKAESAPVSTPEKKNALAAAWSAAASLLKRFTAPRDRETPETTTPVLATEPAREPAPPASAPVPVAKTPFAPPKTVWLDSSVLEDLAPLRNSAPPPAPAPEPPPAAAPRLEPAPAPALAPEAAPEPKPKRSRARKSASPSTKAPAKPKKPKAKKAAGKPKSKAKKPRKS
jgi:serine/threonine-protein kinase